VGSGAVSSLSPVQSPGCPAGSYIAGASVTAGATPNGGYTLLSWSSGGSGVSTTLTMPAAPLTLTATFAPCRMLTLTASGCGTVAIGAVTPTNGCPAGSFAQGTSITVPATANSGCTFSAWSGASTSAVPSLTFTVPNAAFALQANFKQCYRLTLATAGGAAGGSVTPSPSSSLFCDAGWFVASEVVTITASNGGDNAFSFTKWSGAVSVQTNPVSYTMLSAAASITANFASCIALYSGMLTSGGASGSVSAATTTWPNSCSAGAFPQGAPMTIAATADAGSTLTKWVMSTGGSTTANPYTFPMPASALTLNATFSLCYPLTVVASTGGTVNAGTPTNYGTCAPGSYPLNVMVSVTATPSSGFMFAQWSGPSGTVATATWTFTTVQAASTLTASFKQCSMLTLPPSYIACGGTISPLSPSNSPGCPANSFVAGTAVTVSVTPNADAHFLQWTGLSTASTLSITVTMPLAHTALQPIFEQVDFVYGQRLYTEVNSNNYCAPGQGFFAPSGAAINSANEFFVADSSNNRILVFPYGSVVPVRVIGQPDFSSRTYNRGQGQTSPGPNTLCNPAGLAVDADGNLLVADQLNHRVLVFPPGADASTSAIRVYGQNGLFTMQASTPISANSLNGPGGIAVGAGGVFIVDSLNRRVLFYSGTSTTATRVYGQVSFTQNDFRPFGAGSISPYGIALDASGGIYVSELNAHRILYFPAGGPDTNPTASRVIGQASFTTASSNGGLSVPTAETLYNPYRMVLRADGLYVADGSNHRVLRFPLDGAGFASPTADRVYGQPDFATNVQPSLTSSTFRVPQALAFDSDGDMYVVDTSGSRALRITP